MSFVFNPPDGYRNTTDFPTKPANETAFRDSMQDLLDQIRDEINSGANSAGGITDINRQAIINGNFDVWQRGTSFAATSGLIYTADRWATVNDTTNQASSISVQPVTDLVGSSTCLRYQRNAGQTGVSNSFVSQSLETINSKKLVGKQLTLSFWARVGPGTAGTTIHAEIISGTGTDQNVLNGFTGNNLDAAGDFVMTTSWKRFSITTNVIAPTKTQIGILIRNAPSGIAGATDYYEVAQVMLNVGNMIIPFTAKTFAEELAACQRYYQRLSGVGFRTDISNLTLSNTVNIPIKLSTSMRIPPTVIIAGTRGTDWFLQSADTGGNATGTLTPSPVGTEYAVIRFNGGTFTVGTFYAIAIATNGSAIILDGEF